jgi:hypothetical protein
VKAVLEATQLSDEGFDQFDPMFQSVFRFEILSVSEPRIIDIGFNEHAICSPTPMFLKNILTMRPKFTKCVSVLDFPA